jgi:L-rhamnose mutarotase
MKRAGFLLKVKDDPALQAEYKRYHRAVWPEQLDALRRHGWRNFSLFMRPDGLMFGYVETPGGLKKALDGMAEEEVNLRWQEVMKPFFEVPQGARPDQSMVELEEVFYMEGAGYNRAAARRMCFQLKVKSDAYSLAEYKRTHSAVWPEMIESLTRNGWGNYSIWMRPDGTIYLYSEMWKDPEKAGRAHSAEEVSRRWSEYMKPLFEVGPGGSVGDRVDMEEVFHTD